MGKLSDYKFMSLKSSYSKMQSKKKQSRYTKTVEEAFVEYKRNAMCRRIKFSLAFWEFKLLWQKPCFYCGIKIHTIGIDRINNRVGYNLCNVTPCCQRCNTMKMEMGKQEFFTQVKRIAKKQNL